MKRFFGMVLTGLLLGFSPAWAQVPTPPPDAASNTVAAAAPEEWQKQVVASLTLNQAAFNNWAQGGTDMISFQAGLNAQLLQDNPGIHWLNSLKLQYGLTYLGGQGTQVSADTIDFESVYSWKTWPVMNPFISLEAQSQFGPGYDYSVSPAPPISDFMDPGYFTESAGLKYVPSPIFNTRLGLAVKETLATRYRVPYTVNPQTGLPQDVLTQVGVQWVSELNCKLSLESNWSSKLDAFWPGPDQGLDRTVVEWDNLLNFSLGKPFCVNLEEDLRYDSAIYNGIQVKETLGLGFNYSLL